MSVLLATTNPGKLREIHRILDGPSRFKTLSDFPDVTVADETGASFAENARQKALHYAAPVGEKDTYVERLLQVVRPFVDASAA